MKENTSPILIAGLGNPGRKYRRNRHNIGFMVLDALAEYLGKNFTKMQMNALVTKANYQAQRLILAKPQTYMNNSGQAIKSLAHFYKIPLEKVLVVYDDVDLPFDTIRLRPQGGSAGQKGMKSTIEQLNTQNFPRLRVGIGRPPGRMQVADYVLQNFSDAEVETLNFVLNDAVQAILTFITEGIEQAMTQHN
ncbi:MAG: aminoacyl-tRNA hydrolase [Anaerolinea sp. 4484_236]|nr:MAG: aminoacyl-tRNA hydrolase [Anaerolinea sp. 4484_236]RLD11301.1 MAG: aminoacyl-tRNA hydrolase [Chloroflexota bacterium]